MPDIDHAIAGWRQQMADAGLGHAEVLDELEDHLRDDIEARTCAGVSTAEAFASSVSRLGDSDLLKTEFDKTRRLIARQGRLGAAFLTLAGISSSHNTTIMNASFNIEPRWATYTKATAFAAPAICLWTFSVMFLMPKLQQLCHEAGVALPWPWHATAFIANHTLLTVAAIALPFVLLEWRWSRWPKYRRASLGGAAFLINAAVLALITLMVILALLAAPALMQHSR
jgi:hypothetical protein